MARKNHRFFAAFLLLLQAACVMLIVSVSKQLHRSFARCAAPHEVTQMSSRCRIWPSAVCQVRSHAPWRDWETYVLLALDVVYAYSCLVLVFGWGHCAAILCGACVRCTRGSFRVTPLVIQPVVLKADLYLTSQMSPRRTWPPLTCGQMIRHAQPADGAAQATSCGHGCLCAVRLLPEKALPSRGRHCPKLLLRRSVAQSESHRYVSYYRLRHCCSVDTLLSKH